MGRPHLAPLVARKLREQLPELRPMLCEYQRATLVEKLRNGDVDVGILALPKTVDSIEGREL